MRNISVTSSLSIHYYQPPTVFYLLLTKTVIYHQILTNVQTTQPTIAPTTNLATTTLVAITVRAILVIETPVTAVLVSIHYVIAIYDMAHCDFGAFSILIFN